MWRLIAVPLSGDGSKRYEGCRSGPLAATAPGTAWEQCIRYAATMMFMLLTFGLAALALLLAVVGQVQLSDFACVCD